MELSTHYTEIRAKEVDGFTDLVTAYNLLYENYTKSLQP